MAYLNDLKVIKCLYGIIIILMLLNLIGTLYYGATLLNCISAWFCAMIWATDSCAIWVDYYKFALYMQNQRIKNNKK